MEKLSRRLAMVQEDLMQMYPACTDYPTQKAMVDCLSSILDLLYYLDLRLSDIKRK